jgi:hypothetical protein
MNIINLTAIKQTRRNPHSTSDKYSVIPTYQVLEVFADHGWHPAKAVQARVLKEENEGYQRHMARLRNDRCTGELRAVGDTLPEIVLINSHGGASSFQVYMALHEKVCSNGLIVDRGTGDHYRIPHTGYTAAKVEEAISGLVRHFPELLARREEFQQIALADCERRAFAQAAIDLRFQAETAHVSPDDVMRVRHNGQQAPHLWNTLNVVQENVIRGGVPQRRRNGRLFRSREVGSIAENVRLNRALWRLTEEMARLRGIASNAQPEPTTA